MITSLDIIILTKERFHIRRILMNKNTKVLEVEYNEEGIFFLKIYKVYNIEYVPYILKSLYKKENIDDKEFRSSLSKWFKGRGIPAFRDKLDLLLHRLNIEVPGELLDKAFGLSLSDQYWLKPVDKEISYDDINFFDNDFSYAEFREASLSNSSKDITSKIALISPNNTTDGMLRKAWIIEYEVRYLLKGGYKNEILQPFNEVLASEICKRLEFNHVTYSIDNYKGMIVSKCPCFINKDTELITAYQIMKDIPKSKSINDYEEYLSILEKHGLKDARIQMENMYILDYLIMNEDRHLNNFGIIRDVNSLEWINVAPIFDNGESLKITYYSQDELCVTGEGRFFYQIKPFDEVIKVVRDIKRLDLTRLDGIVEWYDGLLHMYQYTSGISDDGINKLCILLNRQIKNLKKLQSLS